MSDTALPPSLCLNNACGRTLPADTARCPHCGAFQTLACESNRIEEEDNPYLGRAVNAVSESSPGVLDLLMTYWLPLGCGLFLIWTWLFFWARYGTTIPVPVLVLLGLLLYGWWITDLVLQKPPVWMIVVGALMVGVSFVPFGYAYLFFISAFIVYCTRVRE